ncbi:MAG: iron-sulfur cluster assembly scaffold protein [Candidatus Nanoarchaeia archaeon]
MDELYKDKIIELYSKKENFGVLADKTQEVSHVNPSCDDEITFEVKMQNNKILDAKFHGKLCFVSTIAAEVLAENIIGMTIEEIRKLSKKDVDLFLGTNIISTRVGCELFPLEALKKLK